MIKSKNLNFIIIFLFVGIWISIGSDPYNFLFLFEAEDRIDHLAKNLNFKDLFNLVRAIFPLFCCIVCLIFLIRYRLYKNQKKIYKYSFGNSDNPNFFNFSINKYYYVRI